jgi:hypothetical protein
MVFPTRNHAEISARFCILLHSMMTLNPLGRYLADTLGQARQRSLQRQSQHAQVGKVHVVGAGGAVTAAYEQLRNAAEYAEEHLLLQRAIGRYYRRVFLTRDPKRIGESAEDLILELTQAGYLPNDTIPVTLLPIIDALALDYFGAYDGLLSKHHGRVNAWTIELLAVKVEGLLSDRSYQDTFTQFAYDYFQGALDPAKLFGATPPEDYSLSLFIAVNRALIKADGAIIRSALLARYGLVPSLSSEYVEMNRRIDGLFESEVTERLTRVVDRHGAPLRVLWHMINTHEDMATLLDSPSTFLGGYEAEVRAQYSQIGSKIKRGIFKSIAFLIITKVIIGLLVEVPYDRLVHGEVLWLPLAINLGFPPLYMVLLSLTLTQPGPANTRALTERIEKLLYGEEQLSIIARRGGKGFGVAFNIVYILLFLLVFGGATWFLMSLDFSPLHLTIFFVFLSTASFLGFRLSRLIREVEVVDSEQNALTMIRDGLYMPFVVVGRWMSDKYAKVNIMTLLLDMAIELPLKTFLHIVRQWAAFISSKKDEL